MLDAIEERAHRREPSLEASTPSGFAGRGGIGRNPAVAGEIDLHPRVRIVLRHREELTEFIPRAAEKAVDVARRHAAGAQQDGHGGGEVLAMAGAALEEEMIERCFGS